MLQELRGFWEKGSYLSVTSAQLASLCSPLWNGPCTQKCAVTAQGLAWVAGLIAVTSCTVFLFRNVFPRLREVLIRGELMEVLASHFQALVKAAVLIQAIKWYTLESQGRHSAPPPLWLQTLARAQGFPGPCRWLCLYLSWQCRD